MAISVRDGFQLQHCHTDRCGRQSLCLVWREPRLRLAGLGAQWECVCCQRSLVVARHQKRFAERVANLTSQLMDFRRLEKGKLTVQWTEGDAALCIRDSVEMMKPLADAKEVRCDVRGVQALIGLIDAEMLRKIVQNLVGNAIKYTHCHIGTAVEKHND